MLACRCTGGRVIVQVWAGRISGLRVNIQVSGSVSMLVGQCQGGWVIVHVSVSVLRLSVFRLVDECSRGRISVQVSPSVSSWARQCPD